MSDGSSIDGCALADSAWMLMATVLVLGMFPGVAFFEAGLLRHKNTTTILAQVFCGLSILSVMWITFGYSLTFDDTSANPFISGFNSAFFIGVSATKCDDGRQIPEALYAIFQLMFACITPLLMTGSFAERFAWGPFIAFTMLWELLVYYPVAHWLWSPQGWLAQMGGLDFAGGIVIHTTAGVSSLVVVAFLGRRHNFDKYHGEFPYSSLPTAAMGATLLWTGWFGFNGGSALVAGGPAVAAVVNSQIGAAFASCCYMAMVYRRTGKPSTIAIMNGAIAGLAGVTPASGYITPQLAIALAALLGLSVDPGVHLIKHTWRLDDALDVSIVHGLTGIIGSLFIGFAATRDVNPAIKYEGVFYGDHSGKLIGVQVLAVVVCGAWAAFWSAAILWVIRRVTPLRVSDVHEHEGLDLAIFQEPYMNIDNGSVVDPHSIHHPFVAAPSESHVQIQTVTRRSNATREVDQEQAINDDPLRPEEENPADRLVRELRASMVANRSGHHGDHV